MFTYGDNNYVAGSIIIAQRYWPRPAGMLIGTAMHDLTATGNAIIIMIMNISGGGGGELEC